MPDYAAQFAFIVLRYCASTKISFLLRTAPPNLIEDAALAHDNLIADCLSAMLDPAHPSVLNEGPFANAAYGQAALPVQLGGLGLGSAQVTSAPAFLASWVDLLRFHMYSNSTCTSNVPSEDRAWLAPADSRSASTVQ